MDKKNVSNKILKNKNKEKFKKKNKYWSSYRSFILTAIGASVGLGNIWKFPYEVAKNGSGFIIIYSILMLIFSLPSLLIEMFLGFYSKSSSIDTFKIISKENNLSFRWKYIGWIGIFTLFIILSFYGVISGWVIEYLWKSINNIFKGMKSYNDSNKVWINFCSDPSKLFTVQFLFMFFTAFIVGKGIEKGIERFSVFLVIMLIIILLLLFFCSFFLKGFNYSIKFLLSLNLSRPLTLVFISALGQSFFSQSAGLTTMIVYGSYINPKSRIDLKIASLIITIANILISILASFVIFPIIFTYQFYDLKNIDSNLILTILPLSFGKISFVKEIFSYFLEPLFFILLFFTALTSSLSMLEPLVYSFLKKSYEKNYFGRQFLSFIISVFSLIIGIKSIASSNFYKNHQIIGEKNFFDTIIILSTNILMPIGVMLCSILLGWFFPNHRQKTILKIKNKILYFIWRFLLKWMIPIGILFNFIFLIF
jgi:NSS family neurotransmitter:Na+ symporter